ncbi:hypothetical protein SAMN05192540_3982 [Maribacter dokdonensis]|uniref:Uncharacterized protein n=1 Tax=Maribacter dokdonensis TaxID=320912 RepID=A0A1H4V1D2_9FLAO|nr:hypothetical protein [Maribacter dokdonensis]SEC74786.1 hypothetical protein SAMN05192540_3982 [Maribacter dokdonensis]
MKFNLLSIFLIFSLTVFSQKNTIEEINKYVLNIDSNSELRKSEYDWNKITGGQVDHGAVLKVWKTKNQIVKVEEQFGASYGRYTRLIYLKNNKPIKAIETEENFGLKNNEIDYSVLNTQYKMQVYVTGFNDLIGEYELGIDEEGKRKVTEPYCDFESVFGILDEIIDL